MKNTLNLFLIVGLIFFTITKSAAQEVNKFRFGLGLHFGLPLAALKEDNNIGLGVDMRFSKGIVKNLDLTLTSGIIAFFPKEYDNPKLTTEAVTLFPIKLGTRYMFNKNIYGTVETGVNFVKTYVYDLDQRGGYYYKFKYETTPYFSYSVGVGSRFGDFDIGARYEDAKVAKFLALRLGYDL